MRHKRGSARGTVVVVVDEGGGCGEGELRGRERERERKLGLGYRTGTCRDKQAQSSGRDKQMKNKETGDLHQNITSDSERSWHLYAHTLTHTSMLAHKQARTLAHTHIFGF